MIEDTDFSKIERKASSVWIGWWIISYPLWLDSFHFWWKPRWKPKTFKLKHLKSNCWHNLSCNYRSQQHKWNWGGEYRQMTSNCLLITTSFEQTCSYYRCTAPAPLLPLCLMIAELCLCSETLSDAKQGRCNCCVKAKTRLKLSTMLCSEFLKSEWVTFQLFAAQSRKNVLNQHLQANHITKIEVAITILLEETHYKGKGGASSCQIYHICFQSGSGEDHLESHLCLT